MSEAFGVVAPELLCNCESRVMLLVSNHGKFREELKKDKIKEKGKTPFPIVVSANLLNALMEASLLANLKLD